ncbi:MAG: 3,4-dehydroadipyl-CoA semialdehyde dehydrogenase [Planctomycetes bacterium]|nr:3,4-dehydroadipyl-CoA semialdehyde dehydrogenase [Planctomycetota bacterium]
MQQLQSYVSGKWQAGQGKAAQLKNPVTEEVLAETSTQGIDFQAALAHARTKGIPALQELNFAERGKLLMAASKAIHAQRDELLSLATLNGGNTRGDAKFDVDGATSTLAYYAKVGERMGEAKFLVDGEGVQLSRSPRYWGEHIYVPRAGVAVHVNAFNFPAWGLAEKAACAWLAGMPVVTKPATATSLVSYRVVQILIEAQVLPEGALSLICGSAGDLLSHLDPFDALAFTGSSVTAGKLRSGEGVTLRGARINVEADSLNAAVLGRDVQPGSDTFDLFVQEVIRDMTQKAGQKCTAIRRVLVPVEILDAAREALVEELKAQRTGNPTVRGVRVGPLATESQLEDVREGVERLKAATKAIHGDGSRGELTEIDHDKGYFMSPVLFEAADAGVEAVHAHEVFGPCATILPYSGDPSEAAKIVGLGQGGLVASVYSDDAQVAGEVALGMAPFNGRINIGSAKIASESLGPGAVLPQLVHGGPGRAGGGEELGGLRGLGFYMQRTALQGYKPLLEKLTSQGHRF